VAQTIGTEVFLDSFFLNINLAVFISLHKQRVIKKTSTLLSKIFNKIFMWLYGYHESRPKPIEPATPQLVAKRFRQLFTDHGIEVTRIPRVFPEITLDDLKSNNSLLKKLSTECIDKAAEFFKVRVEWLEGLDDVIYDHRSCYKRPELFFEFINSIKYDEWDFPFRVITPEKDFDRHNDDRQPFTLLYVEKIGEIGDEDICRYYLDEGWSWSHHPCRIQLKAMALLYWENARHPITLHTVPHDVYFQIEDSRKIPHQHLGALLSNPSVEDYIMSASDSVVSKESDELPAVLEYIQEHNLSELKISRSTINPNKTPENESSKQTRANKGGNAKNQSLTMIKDLFISQYGDQILKDDISARQAAFDFYDSLNEDQEMMLSRSPKDYVKASPDERRMNAMRILTAHFSKNKKQDQV